MHTIVADENLALVDYFFADHATIHNKAGRSISASDVSDCDSLLIRSVTAVDDALLADSQLQFIGTATIGTDHLDIAAIEKRGITWASAAGCNAQAVAEYVITAILTLQPARLTQGTAFVLGIVGMGNVGTRLAHLAAALDWRVLAYDPFKNCDHLNLTHVQQVEWSELLAQSDVISLHVPLTKSGDYPTYHLFNSACFAQLKPDCMLINSARGAVVVEADLIADVAATQRQVVLDVFEFEPKISARLLSHLALATPHIAGYSLEGKARGTQMIYQAWCQHFGYPTQKDFSHQLSSVTPLQTRQSVSSDSDTLKAVLAQHLTELYDMRRDDAALRACVQSACVQSDGLTTGDDAQACVDAQAFDELRKTYPLRREWSAYGIDLHTS